MSNHFLHGSVNEVYRTVRNHFPADWVKRIDGSTEMLLSYGVHGDPDHYALLPLDTAEGSKLLFSRCTRKRGAMAPSYFVHKQILDGDMNTLHTGFAQLLQTPFCSEEEFDRVSQDPAAQIRPDLRWSGRPVAIAPEVLRGILYAMIGRWRSGGDPVVVCVPEMDAAGYNAYTFGAVCGIYECLPTALRGRIGFMTYTTPVPQLSAVGLFFVPEREAVNGIYLNRETEESRQLLNKKLPDSLKAMIDRIVDHPERRQQELENLWELVEADVTPESIGANHYTAFLEYAPLLQMEMTSREQFDLLCGFFRKQEKVPESIRRKLFAKLEAKVTPRLLDDYVLGLRPEDTGFRKYLDRVEKDRELCLLNDLLKQHTDEKIQAVFEGFLTQQERTEELEALDKLLTELVQTPMEICPVGTIDACTHKWIDHAEPVYRKQINGELVSTVQQMKAVADRKVPMDATLTLIEYAEPEDVKGRYRLLVDQMHASLNALPERLVKLRERTRQEIAAKLDEQVQKNAELLAGKYLDAAKRDAGNELNAGAEHWKGWPASLRERLEKLLNGLPQNGNELTTARLGEFDEAAKALREGKAKELLDIADRRFDELDGKQILDGAQLALMYDQVAQIQEDLKKQLSDLNADASQWYDPFYEKTKAGFKDYVIWLCTIQENDLDDDSKRKKEKYRLDSLRKFVEKKYASPSDVSLRENLKNAITRVDKVGKERNKSKKTTVVPVVTSGEIPSTLRMPGAQVEQTVFVNQLQAEAPRQNMPAGMDHKPPEPQTTTISVTGDTTRSALLEELTRREAYSETVEFVYTGADGVTEHWGAYGLKAVKATLQSFDPEQSETVRDGIFHGDEVKAFLVQLRKIKLSAAERAAILNTLVLNSEDAALVKWCMTEVVGSPCLKGNDEGQREIIQEILNKKPEYADVFDGWKNDPYWTQKTNSPFGNFVKNLTSKGKYADQEIDREKARIFWSGFVAGVLTITVVALLVTLLSGLGRTAQPEETTDPAGFGETTGIVENGETTEPIGETTEANETTGATEGEGTPPDSGNAPTPVG